MPCPFGVVNETILAPQRAVAIRESPHQACWRTLAKSVSHSGGSRQHPRTAADTRYAAGEVGWLDDQKIAWQLIEEALGRVAYEETLEARAR